MEYSISETDDRQSLAAKTSSNLSYIHQNSHNSSIGLNLDLVKIIGYQIAAILRVFSMKGLSLLHGSIRPKNIFFKKKGIPEFKLIDFSQAFFLDEEPVRILEVEESYRPPELEEYVCAETAEERANISLEKVD